MSLLTAEDIAKLRANSDAQAISDESRPPVVKLFNALGGQTWLLSEMDSDMDRCFGLCDLGFGEPELGYVLLSEIMEVKAMIEKDLYVTLDKPMSFYADEARKAGRIVT